MNDNSQSIISHLTELRDVVLKSVLAILALFIVLFAFSNDIYAIVAAPLIDVLPEGAGMIATDVASPFFTPIKLTAYAALFLSVPYLFSQGWKFIAPGLYTSEKKLVFPLLFGSIFLFYGGVAFAYGVVFPLAFSFFASVAPEGVSIATDIGSYLGFVLSLFFAFGLAFQIPIVTVVLCWTGATSAEKLAKNRPYIIVGVFVIGMILTPPDIISQTLLALPMWALFEVGLLSSKLYTKVDETEQLNNLVDNN